MNVDLRRSDLESVHQADILKQANSQSGRLGMAAALGGGGKESGLVSGV